MTQAEATGMWSTTGSSRVILLLAPGPRTHRPGCDGPTEAPPRLLGTKPKHMLVGLQPPSRAGMVVGCPCRT